MTGTARPLLLATCDGHNDDGDGVVMVKMIMPTAMLIIRCKNPHIRRARRKLCCFRKSGRRDSKVKTEWKGM